MKKITFLFVLFFIFSFIVNEKARANDCTDGFQGNDNIPEKAVIIPGDYEIDYLYGKFISSGGNSLYTISSFKSNSTQTLYDNLKNIFYDILLKMKAL